jgi:glycosyltransferase involved in cell wall biosynthesis
MSVHNGEKYLHEAIDSILNQTFTDFEFVIINDGSTDSTQGIIESYSDPRIILVNQENIGLAKSLNKGIRLAKGKYIARMDADDVSELDRFEIQYKAMESLPDVGVCGGWAHIFGGNESVWKYPTDHEAICCKQFFSNAMVHPTVMLRRSCLIVGSLFYDQNYQRSQDFCLWVKLSRKFKLINISRILLHHRIHPSSVGTVHKTNQAELADKIRKSQLKELGLEVPDAVFKFHCNICRKNIKYSKRSFSKAISWFDILLNANKTKGLFDHTSFTKELVLQWWSLCRASKRLNPYVFLLFYRSELCKAIRSNFFVHFILFFDYFLIRLIPTHFYNKPND